MLKQLYLITFLSIFYLARSQPCPSLSLFATSGPISCLGACDANGTVYVFNGTPPFTFYWKPLSVTGTTVSGLCAGTHTIIATDANNCVDSTALIISNPSNPCVGIQESLIELKNIKVHPNPVSNTLNITTEKYFEAGTEIKITNAIGQIVLKIPYTNKIDVSYISNGYYTLEIITSNNQRIYSKFVKE